MAFSTLAPLCLFPLAIEDVADLITGPLDVVITLDARVIVIEMYYGDHLPAHFHARYGGDSAKVAIASGEAIAGSLPGRALRLVREWVEAALDSRILL